MGRKHNMLLVQCIALLSACSAASIRADWSPYHELSMAALAPPTALPPDAFFGYSIAYDKSTRKLVSSAPRADHVGHLYSCDLRQKRCRQLQVMMPKNYTGTAFKDHYFWLGATVKADDFNLMVCAPRQIDKRKLGGYEHYGTYGRCYSKNGHPEAPYFDLLPEMPQAMRVGNAYRNEHLTDSFGWSIDFDGDRRARVGSPAMANGRVMTYNMGSPEAIPSFLSGSDSTESRIKYNFGYSIASGNFLSMSPSFAVSTTYGEIGKGKVVIFELDIAKAYLEDGEVGSMYGASLCAAKIHSTRSSLLVGAPAYFQFDEDQDRYHTGMVYIYAPQKNKMLLMKKIEGPKDGGFFGYAIVNVGDMDRDEKDEIAIAAPYEDDGAGAVYLYSGAALAHPAPAQPLQRLQPAGFWSFGLSLTAFSYSDNGCRDLAVGAPGNDKVAVYHCLPVIDVTVGIVVLDNMQKRPDKTSFEITSCLKAVLPQKPTTIKADFNVTVKITHASAKFAKNPSSNHLVYVASITREESRPCKKIKIKTERDGDYELPISFDMDAKLSPDPSLSEAYDPTRATVSPLSSLSDSVSVLAADCRSEVCQPKLSVTVTSSLLDTYVTGSTDTAQLYIVVANGDGDSAYRPRVRVTAIGVEVARAPPACAWAGVTTRRDCMLAGGLRNNQNWNVTETGPVVLDMTKITSESEELRLRVEVFWGSETKPAALWTQAVKLRHDASKVRLIGKSEQGEVVNVTKMDIQTGKRLQHTYTIINTHGTNWKGLACKIWLKNEVYTQFAFPIQIYRDKDTSAPVPPCSPREQSTEGYSLACPIGDLAREDAVTIVIPIFILPGKLESIYDTLNATLETSVTLQFNKKAEDMRTMVTTTLTLQRAHVPLWILLCAGLVGLLLFLLLVFAMYECGCLRRKNKEQLEELITKVNRQSVILKRQTMRLSDSERASLANKTYRQLYDEAEAKEAEGFSYGRATSDQANQTAQPVESDLNNQSTLPDSSNKNHKSNLSDDSDASEADQSVCSMSDKKILIENNLKMQKLKNQKANC